MQLLAAAAALLVLSLLPSVLRSWLVWLPFAILWSLVQLLIAVYQLARIALSLTASSALSWAASLHDLWKRLTCAQEHAARRLQRRMQDARSFAQWSALAEASEALQPPPRGAAFPELVQHTEALRAARVAGEPQRLLQLVIPLLTRNVGGVDDPGSHRGWLTRLCPEAEAYTEELGRALACLAATGTPEVARAFAMARRTVGLTALCLSGGGSLAMFHMGLVKALILGGVLPTVVSGSSGGSIVAAMLAVKTEQELLDDVLVNDISTRYMDEGISWFPPLMTQMRNFVATGRLVRCEDFERCARRTVGELTFLEAFERTGRHVSITVSAAVPISGGKKLLLNHMTAPDVFVWSAVAASCSLPGIMASKTLMAKSGPWTASRFVDGSIHADVPFKRLAATFGVTTFVVSQVNPHVRPFLSRRGPGDESTLLERLATVVRMDLRHRCQVLASLGLLPKVLGHDLTGMFRQRYHGHLTIVPRFSVGDAVGLNAILNPSIADMERFLLEGQRAAWAFVPVLQQMMTLERVLAKLGGSGGSPVEQPTTTESSKCCGECGRPL